MRHRSSVITKGGQVLRKDVFGRQLFVGNKTHVPTDQAATEASDPGTDADYAIPGTAGAT